MDADRFATPRSGVATAPSRRRALRLLAGTTLGGLVGAARQNGAASEQP